MERRSDPVPRVTASRCDGAAVWRSAWRAWRRQNPQTGHPLSCFAIRLAAPTSPAPRHNCSLRDPRGGGQIHHGAGSNC